MYLVSVEQKKKRKTKTNKAKKAPKANLKHTLCLGFTAFPH